MSDKKNEQSFTDRIWGFFSSITLAVVVFSLISITSIVGTIIEQQVEPERNIKMLSKMFGDSAPGVYNALDSLGFTDMYHSWWFITLLFIFAANLIVCSLDRLPKIWKLAKKPVEPLKPDQFSAMPVKREIAIKGKVANAIAPVTSAMQKAGLKPNIYEEDGDLQLYAEKGRYSRLGVYVTHFSILLILAGAVVGIFFGFNASLNLLEGNTSSVAYTFTGKGEVPLGFQIRCDKFDVSFYNDSDTPKSFKSRLTVLENGREVLTKDIEVNTPLRYKGITFYQSSYGYSPNKDALFKFAITTAGGMKVDTQARFGESFTIPGSNIQATITDFSPALSMDESGKLFTYAETMMNPAVFLTFTENGKEKYKQWILKRYPQTWRTPDGTVEFKDLWGAQYTGLQVRKDPGVWIVYLGCIIMGIGLYATFFMSHARIWVRLREEKGGTKAYFAGSVNKNRVSFEQKMDRIIDSLGSNN